MTLPDHTASASTDDVVKYLRTRTGRSPPHALTLARIRVQLLSELACHGMTGLTLTLVWIQE